MTALAAYRHMRRRHNPVRIGQACIAVLCYLCATSASVPNAKRSDAKIVPRAEWASVPRDESKLQKHTGPIREIVLHHSGEAVHTTGDAKKRLDDSIRSWHMEAHYRWGDVAYHYIIDAQGVIYEGRPERFQGSSATKYDLDRKLLICVLGDYRSEDEMRQDGMTPEQIRDHVTRYGEVKPSSEARDAVVRLVAQKVRELGLSADAVRAHRQLAASTCPGHHLQKWLEDEGLPQIRKLVR
jgi:hypothetical protein